MYRKSKRTKEEYIKAGARFELLKHFASVAMDSCYIGVPTKEGDVFIRKLEAAWSKIISDTEDKMFEDHKNLKDSYTRIFYGGQLSRKPGDGVLFTDYLVSRVIVEELEKALATAKAQVDAWDDWDDKEL